jgi:hypothetical protein
MSVSSPENREFKCAACGGVFEKDHENWSTGAAMEELRKLDPETPLEDCVEVCDDCYRRILGED